MNNKMSNGEALACTVVIMFVFLLIFGFINDATEPKCIKGGCDNKRAEGSLEKNMRPVYDSARRQGYGVWDKRLVV